MWPGALARWLVCCVDGWLGAAQLKPGNSLCLSLSFPGVMGWDIKTGILINCAILPPAALNMFWPRQAVFQTSDSSAPFFVLYIPFQYHFLLIHFFISLSFQFANLTLHHFHFGSLTFSLFFFSYSVVYLQFDPNKWKLILTDKVISYGSNDRISQFPLWIWQWFISTCVPFYWPST